MPASNIRYQDLTAQQLVSFLSAGQMATSRTRLPMPKRTKKLIVYLDQNFISEMAKADSNKRIKPEFKHIYELLHKGFLDEKLVVPASWFHDVETSLSIQLKEKIVSYQNYLGQVRLNFPESVQRAQVLAFASKFRGDSHVDPFSISTAFNDNPDKRKRMFNVTVDSQLQHFDFKGKRVQTAQALEAVRQTVIKSNISYKEQFKVEMEAQRRYCLENNYQYLMHLFNGDKEGISDFIGSEMFNDIPVVKIYAKLWSSLLTQFKKRVIKESDPTDIDVISTYLPYVDVFATDAFIADRIAAFGIASDYNVDLFDARTEKLTLFINYLQKFVESSQSVNVPAVSIFVLPDQTIKENSFKLFHSLGMSSTAHIDGKDEWADIFGFDDGKMPKYRFKQIPDIDVPFYGLQDVHVIKIDPNKSLDEIITICQKESRSNKFIIIDKYSELSKDFVLGLMAFSDSLGATYHGYRVYTK